MSSKIDKPAWIRSLTVLFSLLLVVGCSPGLRSVGVDTDEPIALTRVPAGTLTYYPAGEFLRKGHPVAAPVATIDIQADVVIATRQVSQTEYLACVKDGACRALDRSHQGVPASDLPVVGISWRDAMDYAQWWSGKTGVHYRLPTYEEWVHAAGSAYKEDAVLEEFDLDNPAQRWLAEYALETQRKKAVDGALRPFGSFGVNEYGIQDMAGNVWEWTQTCYVRQYLDAEASGILGSENCGVRVAAGAHRSYIPDFIRDAKSGACSVGVPPSNLGFRLVRDDSVLVAPRTSTVRERLGLG